jgi:hypothetical protein
MGLFGGSKGPNLAKLKGLIQKEYSGITFTEKSRTEDKVEITAEIVAKKYFDDGITVRIVAYKSGTCHVFMVFDKLDPTFENYNLINEYNDHSSFLNAYISQKNGGKYLELHASSLDLADENVMSSVICYYINEVLNEKLLTYLQPITKRTYQ